MSASESDAALFRPPRRPGVFFQRASSAMPPGHQISYDQCRRTAFSPPPAPAYATDPFSPIIGSSPRIAGGVVDRLYHREQHREQHRPPRIAGSLQKTARDLQREIRSRAKRRSDVHKPVLELVRRRIETKAALNHVRMLFRVPEFLPGLPVYDVSEVARMVAAALEDDGFVAEVYEPDTLYVSWDKAEAQSVS